MIAALGIAPLAERDWRLVSLAIVAGLACALAIGRALPATMDVASAMAAPLCATGSPSDSLLNRVKLFSSYKVRWLQPKVAPAG
jgi:hypothetical protein